MATVIFMAIFLVLPLVMLLWMTLEKRRSQREQVHGFEVKPREIENVNDLGRDRP